MKLSIVLQEGATHVGKLRLIYYNLTDKIEKGNVGIILLLFEFEALPQV